MSSILIVEDEKEIRQNLVDLFESENFEVYSAKDGVEGYESALKNLPDIILSDIKMPRMDGLEMFAKLEQNKETSTIPFVFLSAKAELSDFRAGMSLGADDYLIKPINVDEIFHVVKKRLQKREREKNEIDEFKNSLVRKVPHELRTPLIGIIGFAELLNDDLDSMSKEEIKKMINIIRSSGHRLHRRIEKLLTYSELLTYQSNDNPVELSSYSIDPYVVSYNANRLAEELEREDDIEINIEEDRIKIFEKYFELIVEELIENAIKYSTAKTPVKLSGFIDGNYYTVTAQDMGPGFPEHTLKRIDTFHQFGKDKEFNVGMGLGLALIQKILTMYKGELSIARTDDKKTLVTVKFLREN